MEKFFTKVIFSSDNRSEYETSYEGMEKLNFVAEKIDNNLRLVFSDIGWEIIIPENYEIVTYMPVLILSYIPYDDFENFINLFGDVIVIKPRREFLTHWISLNEIYPVLFCEMTGDYRKINCEFFDFTTIKLVTKETTYAIVRNGGNKFSFFMNDSVQKNPPDFFKNMFWFFSKTIEFD